MASAARHEKDAMQRIEINERLVVELYPAGELDELPTLAIRTGEGGVVIIQAAEVNALIATLLSGVLGLVEQLVQPNQAARCPDCDTPMTGGHCHRCEAEHEAADRAYLEQLAEASSLRYDATPQDGGLVLRLTPAMQCLSCGELASGGMALMSGKVVPLCGACAGRLAALYG
jgi:hypothetical protein